MNHNGEHEVSVPCGETWMEEKGNRKKKRPTFTCTVSYESCYSTTVRKTTGAELDHVNNSKKNYRCTG